MFPVLGREVVESKQRVSILAQAIGGLLVFQRVARDEGVERQFGSNLGFGHPDLLQRSFGFRLLAFRQLGEHVRGLVHPAALLARFRPDLTGGLPEPECAIGDAELRGHVEPAPLEIEQQIAPVLRVLAGTIGQPAPFLPAFRRRLAIAYTRLADPTGPIPVITSRSGRWPWRTTRWWPSWVFKSTCWPRKSATSASTALARRARAPLRKTSVS